MSDPNKITGHAFISYVREDSTTVDQIQRALEEVGIQVWRDTANLWPGEDWRTKIRQAITNDTLAFIACFSHASVDRSVSYQNEEITLAIEQLRLRPPDASWFIPVRLDECEIPDRDIGGGRTLALIQRVDLFGDNAAIGAARLIAAVLRILGHAHKTASSARCPAPEKGLDFTRHPDQRGDSVVSEFHTTPTAKAVLPPEASSYHDYEAPYADYRPYYIHYQPQVEGVVFNLIPGTSTGGLIVYANSDLRGETLVVSRGDTEVAFANVVGRTINGQREYAAVFSSIVAGNYSLDIKDRNGVRFTIFSQQVAEIDLR